MTGKGYRRASEIGEYVYCHRAWWLHHVQGHAPGNVTARREGEAAHRAHGRQYRLATLLRTATWLLVALALALIVGGLARWP